MPAIVAERYEANVPHSKALIPNLARSTRRVGAISPIPPICIPTELKLAKPQIAKLTINSPLGDNVSLTP